MPARWMKSLSLFLMTLFFCTALLLHGQSSSGSLSGTLYDTSNALVTNATVRAVNTANGVNFTVKVNASGRYAFTSLSAGIYDVSVESPGFKKAIQSHLVVDVASSLRQDFSLVPGDVEQKVEVEAEPSIVQKDSAELGGVTDGRQLQELPINGRDYARFSLLIPGAVARSSYISDLSFDGLHTVHNQYSIDGVDASRVDQPYMANGYERGARLLTGSMESISEFKVQTSGYQAEYGRAAGSLVNIVTKSGGSKYHGELFEYFRNDALDAHNYFAVDKPEFRYNDFGGNIGGHLYKDKTFFFTNYEGSRQLVGIVANGSVPSSQVRAATLAASPALAPILNNIPVGVDFSPTAANYTTSSVSNVREDTGTIRVDHHFSPSDWLFGRFNVNDTHTFGPLFGVNSTAFGIKDHQDVPVRTTNIAIHEQHVFGPNLLNDFLAGMQRWTSIIDSTEDTPLTYIANYTIAQGDQGYYVQNATSFQYGDTLNYVHGRHTFKFGGVAYRIQVNRKSNNYTYMGYTTVDDFINNRLAYVSTSVGDPGHGTRATQFGTFAQDSWHLARNLTVDYGLRWDMETVVHDKDFKTQTYDPSTGLLAPPGGSYYNGNHKDFAPRVGLSYSPNSRVVVHSALGMFYQAYPVGFGAYSVPMNNIAGNYNLYAASTPGLSYPFNGFVTAGSTPSTVFGFPKHKPDIYSTQWNISVATALSSSWALQLAYVGNHGVNLWREVDVNQFNQGSTARPNPNFGDIYLETNTGFTSYSGFQASLMRRVGHGLYLQGNYTFGHVIDDVQDQGLFASEPQDNNNIRAERGNGSGDVRHNFTYSTLYDLPMGEGHSFLGSSPLPVRLLASGWQVNSLGIVRTGVAFNVGMNDNSYGNSNYLNQRPDLIQGSQQYASNKGVNGWLNVDAWKRPDEGTYGNSPRNGWYGPGLTQFDASLIKQTKIDESKRVEFRAEFFNVFNHPNFDQPFSTWSAGSTSFGQIYNTINRTIGTGTQRQIQFALKFHY